MNLFYPARCGFYAPRANSKYETRVSDFCTDTLNCARLDDLELETAVSDYYRPRSKKTISRGHRLHFLSKGNLEFITIGLQLFLLAMINYLSRFVSHLLSPEIILGLDKCALSAYFELIVLNTIGDLGDALGAPCRFSTVRIPFCRHDNAGVVSVTDARTVNPPEVIDNGNGEMLRRYACNGIAVFRTHVS